MAMLFCFPVQNFTEIGRSVSELWPENEFQNGGCPTYGFFNFFTFGSVTVTEFQICVCIPNFIKIGRFFIEM